MTESIEQTGRNKRRAAGIIQLEFQENKKNEKKNATSWGETMIYVLGECWLGRVRLLEPDWTPLFNSGKIARLDGGAPHCLSF